MILVVGLSFVSTTTKTLKDDIINVLKVLPLKDIRGLSLMHLAYDLDFRNAMAFILSDEWDKYIQKIGRAEEAREFYRYFYEDVGVDLQEALETVYNFLTKRHNIPNNVVSRSFEHFVKDLMAIIDTKVLLDKIQDKINESPEFARFYKQLSSQKTYEMLKNLDKVDGYEEFLDKLKSYDIDVRAGINGLRYFFGWYN